MKRILCEKCQEKEVWSEEWSWCAKCTSEFVKKVSKDWDKHFKPQDEGFFIPVPFKLEEE